MITHHLKSSPAKILVATTNLQLIGLLKKYARQKEYFFINTISATETMAQVANDTFTLFILEETCNDMSIYDLAWQIRGIEANEDIPLLFIASQPTPIEVFETYPLGSIDYLVTPFNAPALYNKIELFHHLYLFHQEVTTVLTADDTAEQFTTSSSLDGQLLRAEKHPRSRLHHFFIDYLKKGFSHQEAEARYRDIVENSIEGIFQTTLQGEYIGVNQALVRIYGYDSAEEMLTVLNNEIHHQLYVNLQRRADFIQLLDENDLVTDFESQIYRKDGSIIWIQENARAVRAESGKLLYYEGTVQDITGRKVAEEELHNINQASNRFVPHQLLTLLGRESITELALNNCVEKRMTILFADIRSFTTISEEMTPLDNFQFLNNFLQEMGPIIRQHHGFIDKYLGDGLMALFEEASNAVAAGIEMLRQLTTYNKKHPLHNGKPLEIGIGLNTGAVMLGIIGEHHRLEGTVIGDTVNLAARIEQLTKSYQTPLLIGESTFKDIPANLRHFTRVIGRPVIKGKTEETLIYEVFAADTGRHKQAKLQTKSIFETARLLYEKGQLSEAKKQFMTCLKRNPADAVAQVYLAQC